jgi:hypothetical protein
MDDLKKQIADRVKGAVEREFQDVDHEIHYVDQLNTVIRVFGLKGGGPRYFLVRVSEQM